MNDDPVYFVLDVQPLGAALYVLSGAALGCLAYLLDRRFKVNLLSHVNRKIVENYHPDLIKKES